MAIPSPTYWLACWKITPSPSPRSLRWVSRVRWQRSFFLSNTPLNTSLINTSLINTSLINTSLINTSLINTSLINTSLINTSLRSKKPTRAKRRKPTGARSWPV
ncbi:pentapeptide repeat-containing protein [Vibrio fluvialis]